jgi:hypothetical protein
MRWRLVKTGYHRIASSLSLAPFTSLVGPSRIQSHLSPPNCCVARDRSRLLHTTCLVLAASPDPSQPTHHHQPIMNGANTSPRAKRKAAASPDERPQKQQRALNGKWSAGDNTPDVELEVTDFDDDADPDLAARLQPAMLVPTADPEWQRTIENVVRNVVSIRFCQTCSFDTDAALTSEATGFVVDAERGYVGRRRAALALTDLD